MSTSLAEKLACQIETLHEWKKKMLPSWKNNTSFFSSKKKRRCWNRLPYLLIWWLLSCIFFLDFTPISLGKMNKSTQVWLSSPHFSEWTWLKPKPPKPPYHEFNCCLTHFTWLRWNSNSSVGEETSRHCTSLPDAFAYLRSPMASCHDECGMAEALDSSELWVPWRPWRPSETQKNPGTLQGVWKMGGHGSRCCISKWFRMTLGYLYTCMIIKLVYVGVTNLVGKTIC